MHRQERFCISIPLHRRLERLKQLKPQSRSHVIVLLVLRLLSVKKLLKGIPHSLKNTITALLLWTVFTMTLCEVDVMVKVLVWFMVFFVAVPDS